MLQQLSGSRRRRTAKPTQEQVPKTLSRYRHIIMKIPFMRFAVTFTFMNMEFFKVKRKLKMLCFLTSIERQNIFPSIFFRDDQAKRKFSSLYSVFLWATKSSYIVEKWWCTYRLNYRWIKSSQWEFCRQMARYIHTGAVFRRINAISPYTYTKIMKYNKYGHLVTFWRKM